LALNLALPLESAEGERRVALDPSVVARLRKNYNVNVVIQANCGHAAGFYDDDYEDVPVVGSFSECVANAVLVVKVRPPTIDEANLLPIGSVLVSLITPYLHLDVIDILRTRKITTLAMDLMPRITRAQSMDALSSQATVAGYKAALLAAELSPRLFPMLTTAAGTIRPSRVIVIGAGVAGLQAIATARRLGAQVEAYDIRSAAREQIESLGASMIDTGVDAEGPGGRARALNTEEKQKQHDVLADHMSRAHAVICAAAIPGRRAPLIITEDMVEGMMPDTVIVDMAAETGGNCELSKPGESYWHGDTLIVGPVNLPSSGAVHATEMYALNVYNLLKLLLDERGQLHLDWSDEIISSCLLTLDGNVYHKHTADLMNIEVAPPISGNLQRSDESPDQTSGWIEEESIVDADSDTTPNSDNKVLSDAVDTTAAVYGSESVGGSQSAVQDSSPSAASEDAQPQSAKADVDAKTDEGSGDSDSHDDEPRDDLMAIKGIGPALQNRLYAFQIRTYADLANLDAQGIEKLERQLDDNSELDVSAWVAQAKELEKYQ
jgi:NAD(P) transhydrogenase subunit alpha